MLYVRVGIVGDLRTTMAAAATPMRATPTSLRTRLTTLTSVRVVVMIPVLVFIEASKVSRLGPILEATVLCRAIPVLGIDRQLRIPIALVSCGGLLASRETLGIAVVAGERVGSVNLSSSIRVVRTLRTVPISTFARFSPTSWRLDAVRPSRLGRK